MRKPFAAGNWKMNLSLGEAEGLAGGLAQQLESADGIDVAVCPPFVYLPAVCDALRASAIAVGAQNMHAEQSGAFTGEVAGPMLLDIGCTYVILGHSERRHVMGETNSMINAKLKAALACGLKPIFCIGEKLEQRQADEAEAEAVIREQLADGLQGIGRLEQVTVAYEPVWAIGTGVTATPDQAQEVHAFVRSLLSEQYSPDVASATRVLYGGSVKPENARALMAQPDIDGTLVGGASLKLDSFTAIVAESFAADEA